MDLEELKNKVKNCKRCPLWKTRKNVVFGEGNYQNGIMFVGEAPGRWEDEIGKPFVGRAGHLLDEILRKNDIDRGEIYITNVVKCRPPNNRKPNKEEIKACSIFLEKQIEIINPKLIVCLGNTALEYFFTKYNLKLEPMKKIHGKIFEISTIYGKIKLIPTYHPAAILRNPNLVGEWEKDWEVISREIKATYRRNV